MKRKIEKKLEKNSLDEMLSVEHKTSRVEQKLIKLYKNTAKAINLEIQRKMNAYEMRENLEEDETPNEYIDLLNTSDLKPAEQIIRQQELLEIMRTAKDKKIREQARRQYNAYSLNYRVNRLNDILNSIKFHMITLGIAEEVLTTNHYTNILNSYKKNKKEILKFKKDGFNSVTKYNIDQILKEDWIAGKNYSKRIWTNKEKMDKMLKEILEPGLLSGKSADKIAQEIEDALQVGIYNAIRLVRTESSYFYNQSDLKMYKELGVKQYRILATLDRRTSKICREKDGKIYNTKEATSGVNFPPFHPNCRTTTIAVIEDEDFINKDSKRYAKDLVTNKKYYTTAKNYKEYEKENIAIHGKEEVEKAYLKEKNKNNDRNQFNRYKNTLGNSEYMPKNLEDFINLKYNDINRYETLKREFKTINNIKKINKYPDRDIKNYYKFKKDGIEMTNHSIETYSERMFNKKNKPNYNYNDIVDIFKKENNYEDINTNRWVKYYNKLVLILDKETNEVISFRYGRGSKKWKKL